MALVLCTGTDQAVLETRKLILEAAGHNVITVMDEPSLIDACSKYQFDVAVIGQTVTAHMKRHIAAIVRENCSSVKILELYRLHADRALEDADSWLPVTSEIPQQLAQRVNELAGRRPKRAGA